MKRYGIVIIFTILVIVLPYFVKAGTFIAYSMNEAERRLIKTGQAKHDLDLIELGGITDLAGMVYDKKNRDLIIVGQINKGKPKITLHDFVVAMRAVFIHNKTPLVSIDRIPETARTRKQTIYWEGGIENTKLGKDMLEADILLKKIALDKVPAEVWGVHSYFSMIAEQARKGKEDGHVASRFWFKNFHPSLAVREGVFAIMELDVGVETEVLYAEINGKSVNDLSGIRDEIGDKFARQVAMNLSDLSVAHPVLARARPILALVSLAEGMKSLVHEAKLNYWLYEHKVPRVKKIENFDLIERKKEIEGRKLMLTVSGGFELNPIVVKLKKGYPSALKEAVLNSRPSGNVLMWHPPLEGWHIPGTEDIEISKSSWSSPARKGGFSIDCMLVKTGQSTSKLGFYNSPLPPPGAKIPKFNIYKTLPSQQMSHDVGGVMLQGAAEVSGLQGKDKSVDLTGGNFSLVVDGKNARIAPETFRKFVTALWSVYYSEEDPGISIDPIAPGAKKHMVRYIGKVINNDLGRVMREADYVMKQWAVGTKSPDIPGFLNPHQIAVRSGVIYVGAWSRFWFVPENMKFKRGGDMLLFDDGRMTVKTEYMFKKKGMRADPANEEFARSFTDRYQEISKKYPVYQELFEYAKMVSLAKYLKESGVPLLWFLMANKDLVITEDSPGTVDALAKGSDYFKGITIEGGVNLKSKGKYVYDETAVKAISEAISKTPAHVYSRTGLTAGKGIPKPGPEPFTFDLKKVSYTVIPQHSLTSGRDHRGIRYQTDLTFSSKDVPGLELVRYFNPKKQNTDEYGKGWQLLIPYQVRPHGGKKIEFLNAVIPEKMMVENRITGEKEVLTFSKERYSIAGYVPDKIETSNNIGLFLLSDASFRLADKLGNEFQFDSSGRLTEMIFSEKNHVKFEYDYAAAKREEFATMPFRIEPVGNERKKYLNVVLPARMKLVDTGSGKEEVFIFNENNRYKIAGYTPANEEKSIYTILALMTDTSFVLGTKSEAEISFDPAGGFKDMRASVVKGFSQGDHEVKFDYEFKNGQHRIKEARLKRKDKENTLYSVKYQYDQGGRLCKVITPNLQEEINKNDDSKVTVGMK